VEDGELLMVAQHVFHWVKTVKMTMDIEAVGKSCYSVCGDNPHFPVVRLIDYRTFVIVFYSGLVHQHTLVYQ
jgi:hypothetical protein